MRDAVALVYCKDQSPAGEILSLKDLAYEAPGLHHFGRDEDYLINAVNNVLMAHQVS